MNKYDGLIFDLDGTLWNASQASAKGWNKGFQILGRDISITTQDIENVAGNTYKQCLELLLPPKVLTIPNLTETLNKYEKEMVEMEGGQFFPGVLEGLNQLSSQYTLFIISNCQEWYLNVFWKYSKAKPYFTDWDFHGRSQLPKKDMINNMIKKHQLKKPTYIGDTIIDAQASKASGIDFFHAGYSFNPKLIESVLSFTSFTQLVEYFSNE